ncbi:hypothetical protein D3C83_189700 [compost metagenome]
MMRFASVTHAVVLPNMLATTSGLSDGGAWRRNSAAATMPEIAPAAFSKTARETRLIPATSTIAGIIVMSLVPT